ncbi:hypothetical protein AWC15_20965 [Mycobacterium lacus]|nr:hypothetical protein AWC15_20965 [Mycobacterium lacus]
MHVFEAGLMHVPMIVLGPVVVAVRVLVLDVVVLVRGMRMCVRHVTMVVLVRVRFVMGVLIGHRRHSFVRNVLCLR